MNLFRSLPAACALTLAIPFASASTVLVDFGTGATNTGGYNAVTSLAGITGTPLALNDSTGVSSGLSIAYTGTATNNTSSGAGFNSAFTYGTTTTDAWALRSEGASFSTVAAQGLAFTTSGGLIGSFTLSGLQVGQQYSMMLLFNVGGSGGNATLTFNGLASAPTYTGFENSAGKTGTFNSGTNTATFSSVAASGTAAAIDLTFTASSSNLVIGLSAPSREAVQGLAITAVPEPSVYGLLGAGTLAVASLVRRRKKK